MRMGEGGKPPIYRMYAAVSGGAPTVVLDYVLEDLLQSVSFLTQDTIEVRLTFCEAPENRFEINACLYCFISVNKQRMLGL